MSAAPEAPVLANRRRLAGERRTLSWGFIGRKSLGSAVTLFFILVVNFFLFRVINPHPERTLARGRATTPEQIHLIAERLGLDQPLPQQFWTYLTNIFTGNLGVSYQYGEPVASMILQRLWPSLVLVGTSTVLAIIIGLWIGKRAAWYRRRAFDKVSTTATIIVYAMPDWWLGLLLFMLLAVGFGSFPGLFPIGGLNSPGIDPWSFAGVIDEAWHLTLPVLTLTLVYIAEYSIVMRSSMLDEMGEPYLQTARAKGLPDALVRRRHAAPNAMLPVMTMISLDLAFSVGGAITIETVFAIPGLGLLTSDALRIPDIPMLQGTFLMFSTVVVIANLLANLFYAIRDPRVKL